MPDPRGRGAYIPSIAIQRDSLPVRIDVAREEHASREPASVRLVFPSGEAVARDRASIHAVWDGAASVG